MTNGKSNNTKMLHTVLGKNIKLPKAEKLKLKSKAYIIKKINFTLFIILEDSVNKKQYKIQKDLKWREHEQLIKQHL